MSDIMHAAILVSVTVSVCTLLICNQLFNLAHTISFAGQMVRNMLTEHEWYVRDKESNCVQVKITEK